MLESQSILLLSAIVAALSYVVYRHSKKAPAPYPPGPTAKPFIGNVFDIPLRKPWIKYMEWAKEFNSDIIHLSALNTHIIVLQKMEDIVELLERRSANYSSRMQNPIFQMTGMETLTALLPYGNSWRKQRRFLEEGLKRDSMLSYDHVQAEKVHLLLDQLLHNPTEFMEHCKMLGTSITMAHAFGYDLIPGYEDEYVQLAEFAIHTTQQLVLPGRTLVSVLPILSYVPSWFPGASTQKLCDRVRKATFEYKSQPFEFVKRNMADGTSKHCILEKLLETRAQKDGTFEDEESIKDAVSALYLGGVETMQVVKTIFILAMTLYPAAQKKAQEEIDHVIGSSRLPTLKDRSSLPYVEALYREVSRWRPVTPLCFPHSTTEDDIYKGYYIPKDAVISANVWALTRDETKYPEPDLFRPERFLMDDGTLNDDTMGYSFGFGRRICPGRHMADLVVWLMMVSVLATFDISKARDENGKEIEVDANGFTDSVVMHPLAFKCSIVPRSEQAAMLICEAACIAKQNLKSAKLR